MFADLVKAFMNMCAGFFSWRTTSIENQAESEVIKDKRQAEKRTEDQEDLLFAMSILLQKYLPVFSRRDRLRAQIYINKVKKVN